MKLYLSSYKLGMETEQLKRLLPLNKRTIYISNAGDSFTDLERKRRWEEGDIKDLSNLGLEVEHIDLRQYFGQQDRLRDEISEFGIIWVSGGNLFVLRQAFRLSGFDEIVKELARRTDILYGGYSAGACVLAPTLRGIDIMDDLSAKPYGEEHETIWDGLGLIDYSIVPHYMSDHPESEAAGKVVEFMIQNKIPFSAMRDGEVIIVSES
jgi:dipeptidase E